LKTLLSFWNVDVGFQWFWVVFFPKIFLTIITLVP
jgi:hypothetical protein